MGIRPVLTWKSTAAAPTPIRDGPFSVPSALTPWQVAQFAWKISFPRAIWSADAGAAVAG